MAMGNSRIGRVHQDGTYAQIKKLMRKTPSKLFTIYDIMKPFNKDEKAAESALGYLFRKGIIFRHIEKHPENGKFQFAIKIAENKRVAYEKKNQIIRSTAGSELQAINRMCESIISNAIQLQQTVNEMADKLKTEAAEMDELKRVAAKLRALDLG